MLNIIDRISQKLAEGEKVNPDHLDQAVDFIKTFADKCHHGKEEDLLFKAMTKVGFPAESGPIAVMLSEHGEGRGYVQEMAIAAVNYRNDVQGAAAQFAENAINYKILLTQHIMKENNILFPMADANIPTNTQNSLLEDFERVEIEKIGPGKHEELHKVMDNLKKIYIV